MLMACDKGGFKPATTVVDFNLPSDTVNVNDLVVFVNTSKFANGFVWYFGDGDSSKLVNPTHTYTNNGSYTITLKAFTDEGIKFKTKLLVVQSGNTANASFSIDCDKPFVGVASATFNNTSVNCVSYQWDFNFNGTFKTMSTLNNPSYTFTSAGTYTVKLKGYGTLGDSSETTQQITIKNVADSFIITAIKIVTTATLQFQLDPFDIDDGTDPDYYVTLNNWSDTTKKWSNIIMNSKAFPLFFDLSARPMAIKVPPFTGSVPLYTPIKVLDWDGSTSAWVDEFPQFNIRQYMISPENYPSQITLNGSTMAETELVLTVKWK